MFHLEKIKFKNILDIEILDIPEQKVTSIVGESGSGKTTLLRLLNKLISSDSGKILYNNHDLDKINSIEIRRKVTMLSQTPTIFPGSIKENLLIGLKFSEKPLVSDEKLLQILETVHLNKALNEDAEKLSGGEKQRLAIGRVLLLEPEVFLLDEPSSALDDRTEQILIEGLVNYVKTNNKTLIMVTHSKKVAETFSDNIVYMSNGKIANQKEV
jgi:putative ABC transport system ATP-binding protein